METCTQRKEGRPGVQKNLRARAVGLHGNQDMVRSERKYARMSSHSVPGVQGQVVALVPEDAKLDLVLASVDRSFRLFAQLAGAPAVGTCGFAV